MNKAQKKYRLVAEVTNTDLSIADLDLTKIELDPASTYTMLLNALKETPASSWLLDRYFPTNILTDVFRSKDVLVQYNKQNRKVAPFVLPIVNGKEMARDRFKVDRFAPPNVAPARETDLTDIESRGLSESLFDNMDAEQRALLLAMLDISDLTNMIIRRRELMASEILRTNKCVMIHIGDKEGTKTTTMTLNFNAEATGNDLSIAVSKAWTDPTADIIGDLRAGVKKIISANLPVTDLVCSSEIAAAIVNNAAIKELGDIRNYADIVRVKPALVQNSVSYHGTLMVDGHSIDIYSYSEVYENDDGEMVDVLPAGSAILTAPAAGRCLYAGVHQMEMDNKWHTHDGIMVPKYIAKPEENYEKLTVTSRPVLIPRTFGGWVSFTGIN